MTAASTQTSLSRTVWRPRALTSGTRQGGDTALAAQVHVLKHQVTTPQDHAGSLDLQGRVP
ncbi:hypothetical protein [Actinomyces wuliandei]|uniref:hypothetical protein n=1 Tax=Actinomyces wuliandei TaxID=2057743 RepID=UPI0011190883|nr:hypothetical protein [Actinomyces wuliandei]